MRATVTSALNAAPDVATSISNADVKKDPKFERHFMIVPSMRTAQYHYLTSDSARRPQLKPSFGYSSHLQLNDATYVISQQVQCLHQLLS